IRRVTARPPPRQSQRLAHAPDPPYGLVCRKKLGFRTSPQPATLRGAELPRSHAARGNERIKQIGRNRFATSDGSRSISLLQ
ncbi:hypothetical protein, partial [Candidatus Thiosymbion oneisti]|uniref:hypothetical protein n=1 Tax=Candidatus Thiosymbion oneisti TaxID=589554 RepID=UPI001C40538D